MEFCSKCKKKFEAWPGVDENQGLMCRECLAAHAREMLSHMAWPWGPAAPLDS